MIILGSCEKFKMSATNSPVWVSLCLNGRYIWHKTSPLTTDKNLNVIRYQLFGPWNDKREPRNDDKNIK